MDTSNPALEPLTRTHTVLLTTFRRDGSPVESPVSLAVEGDRAVFRTWDTAWKARRLRPGTRTCGPPRARSAAARSASHGTAPRGCWTVRRPATRRACCAARSRFCTGSRFPRHTG